MLFVAHTPQRQPIQLTFCLADNAYELMLSTIAWPTRSASFSKLGETIRRVPNLFFNADTMIIDQRI
jgi:hypothetical protein